MEYIIEVNDMNDVRLELEKLKERSKDERSYVFLKLNSILIQVSSEDDMLSIKERYAKRLKTSELNDYKSLKIQRVEREDGEKEVVLGKDIKTSETIVKVFKDFLDSEKPNENSNEEDVIKYFKTFRLAVRRLCLSSRKIPNIQDKLLIDLIKDKGYVKIDYNKELVDRFKEDPKNYEVILDIVDFFISEVLSSLEDYTIVVNKINTILNRIKDDIED